MMFVDGFPLDGTSFEYEVTTPTMEILVAHPFGQPPSGVRFEDPDGNVVELGVTIGTTFPYDVRLHSMVPRTGKVFLSP